MVSRQDVFGLMEERYNFQLGLQKALEASQRSRFLGDGSMERAAGFELGKPFSLYMAPHIKFVRNTTGDFGGF